MAVGTPVVASDDQVVLDLVPAGGEDLAVDLADPADLDLGQVGGVDLEVDLVDPVDLDLAVGVGREVVLGGQVDPAGEVRTASEGVPGDMEDLGVGEEGPVLDLDNLVGKFLTRRQ